MDAVPNHLTMFETIHGFLSDVRILSMFFETTNWFRTISTKPYLVNQTIDGFVVYLPNFHRTYEAFNSLVKN